MNLENQNNQHHLVIIAHNIRSTYNIGAIFRTADGLGVDKIFCTGYSPYPKINNDPRMPHIAEKLHKQIHKTALGAESSVNFEFIESPIYAIEKLKQEKHQIIGLEQTADSIDIRQFTPSEKTVLILGEEVDGINQDILSYCDAKLEIPMSGKKESFNVSVAAAISMWHIKNSSL